MSAGIAPISKVYTTDPQAAPRVRVAETN